MDRRRISFGSRGNVQALADGLFLREAPQSSSQPPPGLPVPGATPPRSPPTSGLQPFASAAFLPLPETSRKPLEGLFRAKVTHLLVEEKLLPPERVQVLYSWKHSGFILHAGEIVPPEAREAADALQQLPAIECRFSQQSRYDLARRAHLELEPIVLLDQNQILESERNTL